MMIIVVMGVAGSGNTTVGTMLAAAMTCRFLEGDALHSKENIDKMSHGVPLTDADRAPWLAAIHARIRQAVERGLDLVVACSALKQQYRTLLAVSASLGLPCHLVTGDVFFVQCLKAIAVQEIRL